ncbi:response regulator transcription factor [Konateibacter massiliensis]|uniref:response regulator transcription factor n=1 Tax=Konateibacter massiliensis TaxID=2002841 RepID=UPI000C14E02A|nr:response regulator [Konateibacter massiliensis]
MLNTILVDDEVVAVNALKRRVDWEKYGVENVFTANSMQQAQEVFKKEKIDFMLCDIEMPQGNGLELFEWVKLYYPTTECIYLTCHPEFEYMRKALRLGSADYLLKPVDYAELNEIITQLVERLKNKTEVEKLPGELVLKIAKEEADKSHDNAVHAAKRYILEHIQETIYVEDIANVVFLNSQYLMRIFKKETGLSILEFITEERVRLAKELLVNTDFPINKVADSVGFNHYSYFTKIFKRSTGVAPAVYRQNHKESV